MEGCTVEYQHERYGRSDGDYLHYAAELNTRTPRRNRRTLPAIKPLDRIGQREEYDAVLRANGLTREEAAAGKTRVSHLSSWGGRTLAIIRDEHGEILASGQARCSPLDLYSKKDGRAKALGDALSFLKRAGIKVEWASRVA
jgi:hypothetical protein